METAKLKARWRRSLIKAITYRIVIILLDITVIYLLTRRLEIALGFMIISNVYTTLTYYVHERVWDRIGWGREETQEPLPGNR